MGARRDARRAPAALRLPIFPLLTLVAGLACGGTERATTPEAEAVPVVVPGTYDVSGTTVDPTTGTSRRVRGTILVNTEGDRYTTSFNLTTLVPGVGEPIRAELVGTGSGTVDGSTLVGSAETQMILALVPGVDAGFGLVPRGGTKRIRNVSRAVVSPDGTVEIEIESEAAPGEEQYAPTRTTLKGHRVDVLGRDRG